jgi:hypothetical protein
MAEALRADDPRPAWEALSDDLKKSLSYEEFAERWRATPQERDLRAQQIEQALRGGSAMEQQAAVVYRDGKTVRLVKLDGPWRLQTGLVSRTVAHSPLEAIDIFAQAIDARDVAAATAILTERRRRGINRSVQSFAESLRQHKTTDRLTHHGKQRAELKWDHNGTRYRITLLKEGDEWRVDDFDIEPAPTPTP